VQSRSFRWLWRTLTVLIKEKIMSKIVAITIEDKGGLNTKMDPRFGRAPYFLVVDFDTNKVIGQYENIYSDSAHGAGTGAAAAMSSNGVHAVISGRFGPKAHSALGQLDIEMLIAPEGITASEALNKMAAGDLKKMELKVY